MNIPLGYSGLSISRQIMLSGETHKPSLRAPVYGNMDSPGTDWWMENDTGIGIIITLQNPVPSGIVGFTYQFSTNGGVSWSAPTVIVGNSTEDFTIVSGNLVRLKWSNATTTSAFTTATAPS